MEPVGFKVFDLFDLGGSLGVIGVRDLAFINY